MKPAPEIPNDAARVAELATYNVLDTLPEDAYDAITFLAAQICDVPVAFISLMDDRRQWFKSSIGVPFPEVPREISICTYAMAAPGDVMVVPDLTQDARFEDHPAALADPPMRLYAGARLANHKGFVLGTLCVMDNEARELTSDQVESLRALSAQVIAQLELRRTVKRLNDVIRQRESLIATVSHEIRTPLAAVSAYVDMLTDADSGLPTDERHHILERVARQAGDVTALVEDLLVAARSEAGSLEVTAVPVNLAAQVAQVLEGVNPDQAQTVQVEGTGRATADPNRVRQVIRNLLSNAFRYGGPKVSVSIEDTGDGVCLKVCDDGDAIPAADRDVIFEPYGRSGAKAHADSIGLGLSISRLLAERMNGTLEYRHEAGCSVFELRLPAAS